MFEGDEGKDGRATDEADAIFRKIVQVHNAANAIKFLSRSLEADPEKVIEHLNGYNSQYLLVDSITELMKAQRIISGDDNWVPISCVPLAELDEACRECGCKERDDLHGV